MDTTITIDINGLDTAEEVVRALLERSMRLAEEGCPCQGELAQHDACRERNKLVGRLRSLAVQVSIQMHEESLGLRGEAS